MPEIPTAPPQSLPPRKRRWLRRIFKLFVALILITSLALASIYFYNRHRATQALEEAIAETHRLDPGWRLEDIEKVRAELAPEENAAIRILEAAALIPANWLDTNKLDPFSDEFHGANALPQVQLDPTDMEFLRKALIGARPILAKARETLELKGGRFPIVWSTDAFNTLIPHLDSVRKLRDYFECLALLQSHDGKHDEACSTSRLIVAVGRYIGDEPLAISQLVRRYCTTTAVAGLERTLAQGVVSDPLLIEVQECTAQESSDPILYWAMRGERAILHHYFLYLEVNNIPYHETRRPWFGAESSLNIPEQISFYQSGYTYKAQHAWLLARLNEAVELTKLTPHQQLAGLMALEFSIRDSEAPIVANTFRTSFKTLAERHARELALLRCTQTAIAVERFRIANNRWPASLDEVVAAKLLDKVPEDPYDGKPLRYRKTTDGVVVYSIGLKGTYAGDALDAGRTYDPNFTRYEFRLWDEAHRRQPPRPKVDEKKDGGSL